MFYYWNRPYSQKDRSMRSYILIAIFLIQKPAEFFGAMFDREAHHPPGVSKLCDMSYP